MGTGTGLVLNSDVLLGTAGANPHFFTSRRRLSEVPGFGGLADLAAAGALTGILGRLLQRWEKFRPLDQVVAVGVEAAHAFFLQRHEADGEQAAAPLLGAVRQGAFLATVDGHDALMAEEQVPQDDAVRRGGKVIERDGAGA